jgi:hypothetical protein
MLRHSLALAAVVSALCAAGCTHCDTCDEFPVPCTGAQYDGVGPVSPVPGGYTIQGPVTGPAPTTAPAAPYGTTSPFAPSTPPSAAPDSSTTPSQPTAAPGAVTPPAVPAPETAKPVEVPPAPTPPAEQPKAQDTNPKPKADDATALSPPLPFAPERGPGSQF